VSKPTGRPTGERGVHKNRVRLSGTATPPSANPPDKPSKPFVRRVRNSPPPDATGQRRTRLCPEFHPLQTSLPDNRTRKTVESGFPGARAFSRSGFRFSDLRTYRCSKRVNSVGGQDRLGERPLFNSQKWGLRGKGETGGRQDRALGAQGRP
jgi:hypothetical protein